MIKKTKKILCYYASMVSNWLKNGVDQKKKTKRLCLVDQYFISPENYIDTQHKLDFLVRKLKSKSEIAVDLEGNSLYSYHSKICLIQISTRNENFVIDPLSIKDISILGSVFSDKSIEKIIHGSHYDIHLLYNCTGIKIRNLFDTQIAASFLGEKKTGLASLIEKNFNVHLQKKYQKSNWAIRPLSEEMIEYAVSDTKYLLFLAEILKKDLIKKNRLSWVKEECEVFSDSVKNLQPEKQDRIKGFGNLSEKEYPVLEAILNIRNQIAKEKDISPFKVIDRQTIYRIIKSGNINLEKLKQITSSHRHIQKYLPQLLEKIKQARFYKQKPHFIRSKMIYHPEFARKSEKLYIWRTSKAAELNIAPHLVLSNRQIISLASKEIRTLKDIYHNNSLKNWQIQKFSNELYEILFAGKNIIDKKLS